MTKYTAIIVEPRKHKALHFVLNNFLSYLSQDWSIILFHGNTNKEYATNIVNDLAQLHNKIIQLVHINVDNLTSLEYSVLFTNKSFYHYIPTETFLVFQTDAMILKENKDKINSFLQYDYVGAPWTWTNQVGNGGLSLRKKSKMLEIINHKEYAFENEDIYFTHNIPSTIQYNRPPASEARAFSIETVFYDAPFGIHNCWKYVSKENMALLMNTYSEIRELIDLQ
jgi:hypothetical protein